MCEEKKCIGKRPPYSILKTELMILLRKYQRVATFPFIKHNSVRKTFRGFLVNTLKQGMNEGKETLVIKEEQFDIS